MSSRGERIPFETRRFIGGTSLWSYDVSSGTGTRVAVHPGGYDGDLQFYRAPSWSPSGRYIAFLAEGVYGYSSLVVHTLGATSIDSQTPVVDLLDDYGWPAWSPDGRWLAFRQSLYRSESALPVEAVRLIAPGTARVRTIMVKSPRAEELWRASHLVWASDSSRLDMWVRNSGVSGGGRLATVGADYRLRLGQAVSTHGPYNLLRAGDGSDIPGTGQLEPAGTSYVIKGLGRWEGARFPSDDLDFSPDGAKAVFHDPQKVGPAARTTLRVRTSQEARLGVQRGG